MSAFGSEWTLITLELRRFFAAPWNLRIAVLAVPAIWLSLWPYIPSPFVPIFGALFIGLEPLYCNILFRAPNELEALSVLPLSWKRIVLAKNIAALLITLICLALLSIIVLYFATVPPPSDHYWKSVLYLGTVIFPLMHIGNSQSVQHPRRRMGWRFDDVAGGVLMGGYVVVLSIPYVLLAEGANAPLLCLPYIAAVAFVWFRRSPAETARQVTTHRSTLCAIR
jgi:hypothetical protein